MAAKIHLKLQQKRELFVSMLFMTKMSILQCDSGEKFKTVKDPPVECFCYEARASVERIGHRVSNRPAYMISRSFQETL